MPDNDINALIQQIMPAPPPYPPLPRFLFDSEEALKAFFSPGFTHEILLDAVSWGVGGGVSRIVRQALGQLKIPGA